MTGREILTQILDGNKPERIPFCIFDLFHKQLEDREEADKLLKQGLCKIGAMGYCYREENKTVEKIVTKEHYKGMEVDRVTMHTPIGDLTQICSNSWVQEHYLKTPEDYKIMEYIVRNTEYIPDYSRFEEKENEIGDAGITFSLMWRTPMQTILVDYVGVENLSYHLADDFPEMHSLFEAMEEKLLERCKIVADSPCRYPYLLENLTSNVWGPERYKKYHVPVYQKMAEILSPKGKKLFVHYDGNLKSISDEITKLDMIGGLDSLTTQPEGDMTLCEARKLWPNKTFFINLNLESYNLPEKELRSRIRQIVEDAAPDGRHTWLQISEDVPARWKESIPVILDELAAIKI